MMTMWGDFKADKPLHTLHFDSPSHSDTLLLGLKNLRCQGHLLDITLFAEGQAFQAHRAVLASCSDYFKAMFTDPMLESKQSEIRLNGVTAEGMGLLLDYAYTSKLGLNLANIQDVLSAASHIQVIAVIEACSNYLQSQLDLDNCVDIVTIAETYSLTQLRKKVYRFISGHLKEFSKSNEFYRLAPQQLEYLLSCDFPVDCNEIEVLETVLSWLRYHENLGQKQRLNYAARFLRKIHFSEMSERDVETVLKNATSDATSQDRQLFSNILSETRTKPSLNNRIREPSHTHSLINSRGMELAIVNVGGFGINGVTNEITYYLPSKAKWKRLTMIPHVEQCNFGTAVYNNELYVVGGCFNQSLQENIHPFGFRYSPLYNKWSTIAPMPKERCRFSLNVVEEYLYAAGGASEAAEEERLVERYDPRADRWQACAPLDAPRSQHAAAACGARLLLSGGVSGGALLASARAYDARSGRWRAAAAMPEPRADHALLPLGGRVLACGGWREAADGGRAAVDRVDAYDARADRWEPLTRAPAPRYHAGVVAVGARVHFVGGFRGAAAFERGSALVECYDAEADSWSSQSYPRDIWEQACAALYVPKCREDADVF